MLLEFYKRRRATLKGNYLYIYGAGRSVELVLNQPKEVPEDVGYAILGKDSDIVRLVEEKPKKKRLKKVKMVPTEDVELA